MVDIRARVCRCLSQIIKIEVKMMPQPLLIFPKQDSKYKNWSDALNDCGIKTAVHSPYSFTLLIQLVLYRFRTDKLYYVFRYLNTPHNRFKTLLQALIDVFVIITCILLRIKIVWFLHNVDRETFDFFPTITKWRRKILATFCDKVFVMDQYLVKEAQIAVCRDKVDYLCFGNAPNTSKFIENKNAEMQICTWLARRKAEHPNAIFCLSAGSPSPKNTTFDFVSKLVRLVSPNDLNFVLIGNGTNDYIEAENVLNIPKNFQVSEDLTKEFDFVTKVSSDRSVLLTGYTAAYNDVSVLTFDQGFFADFVEAYNLGIVYEGSEDEQKFVNRLHNHLQEPDRKFAFQKFRETHNWSVAARRLSNYCFER